LPPIPGGTAIKENGHTAPRGEVVVGEIKAEPVAIPESGQPRGKFRVFISYSRDDIDFADQLDATLRLASFDTSIDRHAISGGEEWCSSGPR
jgi:hypothetical protein